MAQLALGGDQVDSQEIVDGEAVLAHEVTEPAAQGQPADASVADDAAGGSEAVGLGGPVEFAPEHPAGCGGGLCLRVDANRLHVREVDHQPALAHRQAGDGVAAAADRHLEVVLAGEPHSAQGMTDVVCQCECVLAGSTTIIFSAEEPQRVGQAAKAHHLRVVAVHLMVTSSRRRVELVDHEFEVLPSLLEVRRPEAEMPSR